MTNEKGGKMILWKIYFYFMTLIYILYLFQRIINPTFVGWIDMLVNTLTLIALFGFSFNKKTLFKKFWQAAFFVCIAIEMYNISRNLPKIFENNALVVFASVLCIMIIPIYIATFMYAFRKNALWESNQTSKKF